MQSEINFDDIEFISSNLQDFKTNLGPKLSEVHSEIKNHLKTLKEKLEAKKKELDTVYEDMRQEKYFLAGILIHQGKADSGHYYAYRYNFHTQIWKKYNDANITTVLNENDMMEEAYGYDNKSAYCIIYIKGSALNDYKAIKNLNLLG